MQAWDEKTRREFPSFSSSSIKGKFSRIHFNELMLSAHAKWRYDCNDDGRSSPGKFLGDKRIYRKNNTAEKIGFFAHGFLLWISIEWKKSRNDNFLVIHTDMLEYISEEKNYSPMRKIHLNPHETPSTICAKANKVNNLFMRINWIFKENTHRWRHAEKLGNLRRFPRSGCYQNK